MLEETSRRIPLSSAARGWQPAWSALALTALLAAGALRIVLQFDTYHPGDMDRLVAIADEVLSPSPLSYYHNHFQDLWVYNHLAFFPLLMAPLVDLFNHVLHINTAWAAKLLIGAAELAVGILVYRAAGSEQRLRGLAAAGAWLLAPWAVGEDHPVPAAVLFTLLAASSTRRGWLCGLLLALGIGTRNEVVFFALPIAAHYAAGRRWRDLAAFSAVIAAGVGLLVLPFLLYDPIAFDYGVRGQLQRDASDLISTLAAALLPWLDAGQALFIQENPTLLAVGVNLALSLLALRDRDLARVLLVVALGYLITLPLIHQRYLLFSYGLALFYVARGGQPMVAVAAVLLMAGQAGRYQDYVGLGMFGALLAASLLRPAEAGAVFPAESRPAPEARSGRGATYAGVAAATALVLLLIAGRGLIELPLPEATWREGRFVDLIGRLNRGEARVTAPAGVDPESHVHFRQFTLGGDTRDVIYMHPTSSASWRVDLPPSSRLQFAIAVDPEVWGRPGDGVDFQVEVRAGSEVATVYSAYIDPKSDPAQRRWVEGSVDLSPFGGQVVELVLRTLPHDSPDHDWAGWARPVIRP